MEGQAGIEIPGRSRSLKVNYRTSHQMRAKSDRLLPPSITEADGSEDSRLGVVSMFEGPAPELHAFDEPEGEIDAVAGWLKAIIRDGIRPEEVAILVRSEREFPRAEAAIERAGLRVSEVGVTVPDGTVRAAMHDAKGKEFRAVAVIACDHDVLPSAARLGAARDEASLEEVMATERHLLCVAATRARERLWISGAGMVSEFLEDLLEER